MNRSRRELLTLAGQAAVILPFESACLNSKPEARVIPSRIPLPPLFEAALPVPAVLRPVRADATTDYYEMSACTASARILPGLSTEVWGYNGTFPGPTIEARSGRRNSLLLKNALQVPIVNHLHGGHTPPESDGYPTDLILPEGGFPRPDMEDPQASVVKAEREYIYPNAQRGATLWYHDHRMDFTAPQVWRGLAGFYIIRDDEEKRLPLPREGNELPLMICDRSFDAGGALVYPSLDGSLRSRPGVTAGYTGGVLGDVILVNGAPWPRLDVANTRYRLRILNASNARHYELALDPPPPRTSFVQVGSDGGLLAAPVSHRMLRIAPAERFDVIVDFSGYRVGSAITLINRAATGPAGRIMRFNVVRTERDESAIPALLSRLPEPQRQNAAVTRTFDFSYRRGMTSWTINGKSYDPGRIDARPKLDSLEIWQLRSDFSHPLHLHLVHFHVLSHSGRPGPFDAGLKDTISLRPGQVANILVRFSGYRGRYVFHCHNLEHEDMSMMGNFEVI